MIKTLATKITPETYPIAVACLPGGFVLIKKKLVMDSYLVINDLQFPEWSPDGSVSKPSDERCETEADDRPRVRYGRFQGHNTLRENLSLCNFWVPKKLFKKDFTVVGPRLLGEIENGFFEVTRK